MSGFDDDLGRLEAEFESAADEVEPVELRELVWRALEDVDRTPALLCLLSGRLASPEPPVESAAGIQFVHAGLEVTRRLLDSPSPWDDVDVDPEQEDLDLLAADVLVTMGFDRLIDDYRRVTEVVNTFGSSRARHLDRPETENSSLKETYSAAVEVGHPGDPPEFLLEFAEKLAVESGGEVRRAVEREDGDWSKSFDEPVYDYVREIRLESSPSPESIDR